VRHGRPATHRWGYVRSRSASPATPSMHELLAPMSLTTPQTQAETCTRQVFSATVSQNGTSVAAATAVTEGSARCVNPLDVIPSGDRGVSCVLPLTFDTSSWHCPTSLSTSSLRCPFDIKQAPNKHHGREVLVDWSPGVAGSDGSPRGAAQSVTAALADFLQVEQVQLSRVVHQIPHLHTLPLSQRDGNGVRWSSMDSGSF